MRSLLPVIIVFFSLFSAFSERVISPVAGRFANRQTLVLDLPKGAEAFYSYSDTDPLTSGFAYDGPALIDMTGPVSLRVAVVNGDKSEEYKIDYTVTDSPNPFADATSEKLFIDRVINDGILNCNADNVIQVPKSLSLTIGDGEKPVMKGGLLAVRADNALYRYIPCSVFTEETVWRFIVFLSGGESGTFTKNTVPFQITDWDKFNFTGKNLIWCIDNGIWSASKDEVILDRTKSHVVYWQSVDYKPENTVYSFILPPKPQLKIDSVNQSVSFTIDGDPRYKFSVESNGAEGDAGIDTGLLDKITFDTFEGDCVKALACFAFYCDGVYQGSLAAPYEIDRQPPLPPKFIASEPGNYARHDVSLSIKSEKNASIFVSIVGPYELGSNSYLNNDSEADYIKPETFIPYKSGIIMLRAGIESAVLYKVFAYAKDSFGNISATAAYTVTIDEYNYFLDANATDFAADGSRLHPYNSFSQALNVINEGKFVHFFVSGTVELPEGESVILSNCSFTGTVDARFLCKSASFITVKNSNVTIQNCVLEKSAESPSLSSEKFFVLDESAVLIENSEVLAQFSDSGTAFTLASSMLSFRNSGLTVQSPVYACGISGITSTLTFYASHSASISDTAVNFSLMNSRFDLRKSNCSVIAHMGRIIEASNTNLRLVDNKFSADFDHEAKGIKPVWKDGSSMIIEDKNNFIEGFLHD